VIKTESQAVLNTLTGHGFQDAFKQWQKRWKRCIARKGTTTRVMVASRLKVSFLRDGSRAGNCGWLFIYMYIYIYIYTTHARVICLSSTLPSHFWNTLFSTLIVLKTKEYVVYEVTFLSFLMSLHPFLTFFGLCDDPAVCLCVCVYVCVRVCARSHSFVFCAVHVLPERKKAISSSRNILFSVLPARSHSNSVRNIINYRQSRIRP
jgi:hypothetical protein